MTNTNMMYVLYAVAAIVVLGALWFYMSPGGETTTPTPPAQQDGTTK